MGEFDNIEVCRYYGNADIETCLRCIKKYNMPYIHCCLEYCGKYAKTCKGCKSGIYDSNFKEINDVVKGTEMGKRKQYKIPTADNCKDCEYGNCYNENWCECYHPMIAGSKVQIKCGCVVKMQMSDKR